jgi:hypothetical protein
MPKQIHETRGACSSSRVTVILHLHLNVEINAILRSVNVYSMKGKINKTGSKFKSNQPMHKNY